MVESLGKALLAEMGLEGKANVGRGGNVGAVGFGGLDMDSLAVAVEPNSRRRWCLHERYGMLDKMTLVVTSLTVRGVLMTFIDSVDERTGEGKGSDFLDDDARAESNKRGTVHAPVATKLATTVPGVKVGAAGTPIGTQCRAHPLTVTPPR